MAEGEVVYHLILYQIGKIPVEDFSSIIAVLASKPLLKGHIVSEIEVVDEAPHFVLYLVGRWYERAEVARQWGWC